MTEIPPGRFIIDGEQESIEGEVLSEHEMAHNPIMNINKTLYRILFFIGISGIVLRKESLHFIFEFNSFPSLQTKFSQLLIGWHGE